MDFDRLNKQYTSNGDWKKLGKRKESTGMKKVLNGPASKLYYSILPGF
jgi:hypothetical protein